MALPKLSLVVLIGPSGSGKSTFARRHFLPTEVLSSDYFRGLISDDENDQTATTDAFETLHFVAAKRLQAGRLTVIDATNVQPEARRPLVQLARKHHVLPVAVVFDLPERVCQQRNAARTDREFGLHVIRQQASQLRRAFKRLKGEGFRHVFAFRDVEQVDAAVVERVPLWNDRRQETGPFDVIGDVHGCCDELETLLSQLGYEPRTREADAVWGDRSYAHPAGRKAVFVGDLVDRGPRVLDVLRIVRNMISDGNALCVPGNHDMKLLRALRGKDVQITHGLDQTLGEIEALPETMRDEFRRTAAAFLDGLVSHYVLDGGKLVVAHAGMRAEMQGRGSGQVRDFALYGETTGETDEFGLPVRHNWAADYRGAAMVVYGHTPVPRPDWLNNTVNIDTGCVFGGALTALRYPEREFVSTPARRTYCEPRRPFLDAVDQAPRGDAQQRHDELLDLADVLGKRIISTRLRSNITIREGHAAAALEVMSRFAIDPRWLVYLPPTMSPCETSRRADFLEHPEEALAYYRSEGVPQVVCQEKHMGSRAVVVVARDEAAAQERFGAVEGAGAIYTRTGRAFFPDASVEAHVLDRMRSAMSASGFWESFDTTWAVLDCELMPWSAKALELLRSQFASTGAAARAALPGVLRSLEAARARLDGEPGQAIAELEQAMTARHEAAARFVDAYRRYCWNVDSIDDYRLAPFHLLATEGRVHNRQTHVWHLEQVDAWRAADPSLIAETRALVVDVTRPEELEQAVGWWSELTERGGEGMVVKPLDFETRTARGPSQPAVKCRGAEYLRIIYGADYLADTNLSRLRQRALGAKRSLALREFALGIEALERFVRREPLRRVHECVFGVLALESEPVDPRL